MNNPNISVITESITVTNDGYTIGNKNLDAVTANTIGIVSMGSDGYFVHAVSTDGYGRQNININGLTDSSNFGYARSVLLPGTIGSDYTISTAAQAANTAGTTSYKATHSQVIMSPNGGNANLLLVDGQTVLLPMVGGFVYSLYVTKIFTASTTVNDLQIFI